MTTHTVTADRVGSNVVLTLTVPAGDFVDLCAGLAWVDILGGWATWRTVLPIAGHPARLAGVFNLRRTYPEPVEAEPVADDGLCHCPSDGSPVARVLHSYPAKCGKCRKPLYRSRLTSMAHARTTETTGDAPTEASTETGTRADTACTCTSRLTPGCRGCREERAATAGVGLPAAAVAVAPNGVPEPAGVGQAEVIYRDAIGRLDPAYVEPSEYEQCPNGRCLLLKGLKGLTCQCESGSVYRPWPERESRVAMPLGEWPNGTLRYVGDDD